MVNLQDIHNDIDTQFTGSLRQIPFFSTNACAEEKKCGGSRIFGAVISFVVFILYLTMMSIGIVYYNVCQDTRVAIYNVVQGASCSLGALLFFIAFVFKSEAACYPIVITPLIYLFIVVWGCIGAVISFVVFILYLTMMSIGIVYYNVCQDTRVAIYNVVQGASCSLGALLFFIAFVFKSEAACYPIVITPLIYLFIVVWGCIGVYWASYFCQDTPQYIAAVVFSGPIAVSFGLIIGVGLKVYCG